MFMGFFPKPQQCDVENQITVCTINDTQPCTQKEENNYADLENTSNTNLDDDDYAAWIGDAMLALDARLLLKRKNIPMFQHYTCNKTLAAYMRSKYPKTIPKQDNDTELNDHSVASIFEARYARRDTFRRRYLKEIAHLTPAPISSIDLIDFSTTTGDNTFTIVTTQH